MSRKLGAGRKPLILVALLVFGPTALRAADVPGRASLAAPGNVTTVSAAQSLPVLGLPVPAGSPVPRGALIVEVDLSKLQRELNAAQKELNEVQAERRFRASNRQVVRRGGNRQFDGPGNSMEANLEMRESDAMRELLDVQTKLSTAQIRAPEDGYVVEHLLAPGGKSKKRKPAFDFVELSSVRVTIEMELSAGSDFPPDSEARVSSSSEPDRSFRARVDSLVTTSEGGAVITLEPLELPFLALGASAPVTLSNAG
jgi:multidrug resistance efflux pump